MNKPVIHLNPQNHLTFEQLLEGVGFFGACNSGKDSAMSAIALATLLRGVGWFGVASSHHGVITQLQWAYDAGRIVFDQETGKVSGGVYILGSTPTKWTPYTIVGKDGNAMVLYIRDSQINFLDAEMSAPQSGQYESDDRDIKIANIVTTIRAAVSEHHTITNGDGFWPARWMLLNSLLTILYSAKQHLTISDIQQGLISLSAPKKGAFGGTLDWADSQFGQFLKGHQEFLEKKAETDWNLRVSLTYFFRDFPSLDQKIALDLVKKLSDAFFEMYRDPLHTMCSTVTTVPPESIRQGNVFIFGPSQGTHVTAETRIAGIIYKRTFQRALERTPLGRVAVVWCEGIQHFITSEDVQFQDFARGARTLTVCSTQTLVALGSQKAGESAERNQDTVFLFSKLNSKFLFRINDPATRVVASDMVGWESRTVKNNSTDGTRGGENLLGMITSYHRQIEQFMSPSDFASLKSGGQGSGYVVEGVLSRCGLSNGKSVLKVKFHHKHMAALSFWRRAFRRICGCDNYVRSA